MGVSVIRHDSDAMIELARTVASLLMIGAIFAGPPALLLFWTRRAANYPRLVPFLLGATCALTALVWPSFAASEWLLELQFLEVVPGGSWTEADEARWSVDERRIVRAYFGDGGRNVLALFAPPLLALYSALSWLLLRRRAV